MPVRHSLAVLALSLALPARAGFVMEGTDGGESQTVQIDGARMRVETKDGVMIFDGATKTLYQVDPARKNYREMTEADMKAMRGELDKAMAQMPPEVRKQMEAQMGGARAPEKLTVKWEKTGKKDKGLGRSCEVYRSLVNGKPSNEFCVVPFESIGAKREDFRVFEALAEFMQSFAGRRDEASGGLEEWRDVPGVPVITWDVSRGGREEDFRATKLERASFPADRFKPPAGFEKIPTR